MPFDGKTYDRAADGRRLWTALSAVHNLMSDGRWRTLSSIKADLHSLYAKVVSEAGISARLRDLRKEKFGALKMESRRRDGGVWQYRVILPAQVEFDFVAIRAEKEPAKLRTGTP